MSVEITSYLKKALLLDAVVSGAAGVLMAAGAAWLGPFLALPVPLLFWAGLALFPFVALLVWTSRRRAVSRTLLFDIVLVNAAWVVASAAILVLGLVQPTMLGVAFVVAQALAVALFMALQASALRSAPVAA